MSVDTLRPYVRRLAERASQRAFNWALTKQRSPEEMIEAFPALSGVYASSAALLAMDWYRQQDKGAKFQPHADADLAPEKIAAMSGWVFAGPQTPESRARVAAHRLVFDAARRTVFVNASEEGVGIARHESATECGDCRKAASTSVRHRHSGSGDVEQFFHPMCEGLFVPVRQDVWTPPDHMLEWAT